MLPLSHHVGDVHAVHVVRVDVALVGHVDVVLAALVDVVLVDHVDVALVVLVDVVLVGHGGLVAHVVLVLLTSWWLVEKAD